MENYGDYVTTDLYGTGGDIITEGPTSEPRDKLHYLGDAFTTSTMLATFVLATIAIPLNFGVMRYYQAHLKNTIPFMYFTLSLSDFVTGVSAALHSLIFLILLIIGDGQSVALFCIMVTSYFITVMSFRVSAFVSLVFAVVRTIMISYPFANVCQKAIVISIIAYAGIWGSIFVAELSIFLTNILSTGMTSTTLEGFTLGYFYQPNDPKLMEYIIRKHNIEVTADTKCAITFLYTALPVTLCAILAAMATLVQIKHLLRARAVDKTRTATDWLDKKKMSVTIIAITFIFVTCSCCVLYKPAYECLPPQPLARRKEEQLFYIFAYFPFFLNAALNPLVLFVRVKQLRSYFLGKLGLCSSHQVDVKEDAPGGRGSTLQIMGGAAATGRSWSQDTTTTEVGHNRLSDASL